MNLYKLAKHNKIHAKGYEAGLAQGKKVIIGEMYEFARDRMDDSDRLSNSPRDKWKATGVRELLSELFRYLKELKAGDNND
jgi:hypothetical protein